MDDDLTGEYSIEIGHSLDEGDPSIDASKRAISQAYGDLEAKLKERSKELSPKLESNRKAMAEALTDYYEGLGIDYPVDNVRVYVVGDTREPVEGGEEFGAKSEFPNVAVIPEMADIKNESMGNYVKTVLMAHEMYHATRQVKFGFNVDEPHLELERVGLHYVFHGKSMPIVEEIAAVRREEALSGGIIADLEPEGREMFQNIISWNMENGRLSEADARAACVLGFDEKGLYNVGLRNPLLHLIGDLLVSRIPDFDRLVEKARIKGETIALARAVDEAFGRGSYMRLVKTENTPEGVAEVKDFLERQIG